jgi:hypothetical protein
MEKSMKIKLPTPQPSLWPRDKAGVLAVAKEWADPAWVALNDEGFARLPAGSIERPEFAEPLVEEAKAAKPEALVPFIESSIALNSINHMFWRIENGQFERYGFGGKVGAEAMGLAFFEAWRDPSSPLSLARLGRPLTEASVREVFGDIPGAPGRAAILNEVLAGARLGELAREIAAQVGAGEPFRVEQAAALADAFPLAYGDAVLKKAQLSVSDAWRCAREAGLPRGCELTAFADYQIPNVLRALGLLAYSEELARKIDARELIEADSPGERALRGASILAVERLAQEHGVHVADVDFWLWLRRKEPKTPFHLTVTTLY